MFCIFGYIVICRNFGALRLCGFVYSISIAKPINMSLKDKAVLYDDAAWQWLMLVN